MANNLRAASSINDLRTQAHLALSARLQSLDLTPLLIYTLGANIPESILPYLIWQLDMMVPSVPMLALGVTPQAILQNALSLHKIMGTPAAIIQALALCGYTDSTILEGQSAWGGSSWPANQGWAVFRVGLGGLGSGVLYSQAPAGLINGANQSFTLPAVPATGSLRVFYNGLLLRPGTDFTSSGMTLSLTFAPASGSSLGVAFRTGGISSTVLAYLTTIVNFFKPARCWLDSITSEYPLFFDAVVPTVSGSNLVLPETPTSLELYRNGLYQTQGIDFTLAGATITPTIPPGSDSFIAWGTYAGGSGTGSTGTNFSEGITPAGTIDGANKNFTLPQAPIPTSSLKLYLGWMVMKQGVDYTLSGNAIVYATAPPAGSTHQAFYRY